MVVRILKTYYKNKTKEEGEMKDENQCNRWESNTHTHTHTQYNLKNIEIKKRKDMMYLCDFEICEII